MSWSCCCWVSHTCRQFYLLPNYPQPQFQLGFPNFSTARGGKRSELKLPKNGVHSSIRRIAAATSVPPSWDDKPYEILAGTGGIRSYFDEQDVVSFLDPPSPLIPLDPSSFNPAAYLQKKIADIPEERRHHLLSLLTPRLISRAWTLAGTRYKAPKLAKKVPSGLLGSGDGEKSLEFWNCRTSGGPAAIAWINSFKKALFCSGDGKTYGRVIGGSMPSGLSKSIYPLYFMAKQVKVVMPTEEPCDFAYEFGDGHLEELQRYPQGFPEPGNHPWPFNDEVVIYVRGVGPGVLVGQAWQEGKELEVVPKKLCDEILMVKDYAAASGEGRW